MAPAQLTPRSRAGRGKLPPVGMPGSRRSLLLLLVPAPLGAKDPRCLSANTEEPLCGPGAWWLVLATGRALWHWGWAGGHRPGCHPPPGVPTHLGGSGRQGNHSTPGSVALCLPFFSFCFVRCSREVAGAELFTFEAKYFVRWRKWPLK